MDHAVTNPFDLTGEVALVTGGGTGLGLAIAESMVAAGARVILLGRREGPISEAAARLGERASYLVEDVTKLGSNSNLAERASEKFGPISILVNNAGVHLKKPAMETSDEEFQRVLATHVLGSHAAMRALVPGMLERGRGSVLFIASMASLFGFTQVVAYSAAKSAMLGMVRSLATELSPRGVRVNAIAPGWIDSVMMRQALAGDPRRSEKILSRTPMQRFGKPEEIGPVAVFLSSPAAAFITGVCLPVDGGVSIGF